MSKTKVHRGALLSPPMKQAVINWILQDDKATTEEGQQLLRSIYPGMHIPSTRSEVFNLLGRALKSGDLDSLSIGGDPGIVHRSFSEGVKAEGGSSKPKPSSARTLPADPGLPGLSPSARLSMEVSDLQKQRAYFQNKLVQATSDNERKQHVLSIDKATDAIAYKKKLIKGLDSGDISSDQVPENEADPAENYFETPESLYELDKKLQRLRSTRSKRKAKLNKLVSDGEQNSPKYQQTLTDFEQLDKAIRQHEQTVKKIRAESASE